jgi:hypothetical protein
MLKFAEAVESGLREQFAVRRKDFTSLQTEVRGLAAAQRRTEEHLQALTERVDRLAAAQERTEQRVSELAAAQERTERILASLIASVDRLAKGLEETNRQLGGLTMTVGYQLEDMAYRALPALLARDHNLTLEGRLKRGYLMTDQGLPTEVNILGTAWRNGDEFTIVGESKAQLSKNDIDRFLRRKVARLAGVHPPLFPVLVTYMTSEPDGETYAQEQDVVLYYSYDFLP